jgi:hypothetical protein
MKLFFFFEIRKMDPRMRAEIERRRALDISNALLTDEEILAEIRREKSGKQPIQNSSDAEVAGLISGPSGRRLEPFLKEVFKFIAFVKNGKSWGTWEWSISQDERLVLMGSWRLRVKFREEDSDAGFPDYQDDSVRLPKKYFDRQPESIRWPRSYEMRKSSGIHRLIKRLKRKKVISLKRKNGQWWLQVIE